MSIATTLLPLQDDVGFVLCSEDSSVVLGDVDFEGSFVDLDFADFDLVYS